MSIILEESYPASRGSPSKIEQPLLAGQSRHCNVVVIVQGQHQKKRDARLESLPCFVAYSKKKRKGLVFHTLVRRTYSCTTLCGHCVEGVGEGKQLFSLV